MTGQPLGRSSRAGRPAPPVRILHLGLGNFFRAHQAWYTDRCPDSDGWGYAAFAGRSSWLADALRAQDGLYTLVTRGATEDHFEVVGSLARPHRADEHEAWLSYWRSAAMVVVTSTITEAGYLHGPTGGIDTSSPAVRSDIEALRSGNPTAVRTGPARMIAGLAARRAAEAGPVTVVPCDNLAANGAVMDEVLTGMAALVDPALASWMQDSVSYVTTVVDRITPGVSAEEAERLAGITGFADRCPVLTEPFSEWVMSGTFLGGRPSWESSGAIFTDDAEPYERRKLWLLNGAHSLMAYAGSMRGHTTVPEAIADPTCRAWIDDWWLEASRHIPLSDQQIAGYQAELLRRFANVRMADRLARIAQDGSHKIPVRVLPVLSEERASGRMPRGALRILAGWICHLRGAGAPVDDAGAEQVVPLAQGPIGEAARRILDWLDPSYGSDGDLVAALVAETLSLG